MGIYKKLMTIQSELKCQKTQLNSFGGYKYRSCEDILEAVKPILSKVKAIVTITDKVVFIGDRYYIEAKAKLVDVETSESVETTALAREDNTKKGQDLAQVTGSVSSYARKYALNGLFCIDDTKDADSTNEQVDRLLTIAAKAGFTTEQVKKVALKDYKKTKLEDLSKGEYDKLVSRLEKTGDKT